MTDQLVLVSTSPRVAPGCLTWEAWQALRSAPVWTAHADHPQLPALAAAGIEVRLLAPGPAVQQALAFRGTAAGGSTVWLVGSDGDEPFLRALADLVTGETSAGRPVEVEAVPGSYDLPGARLLDAVAVMDRLRSPGGCPWDAQQTHRSLGKYLLEEAYEAYEAIEEDDLEALREEMGDVLLQVLFHARLAQEAPGGWDVDDAAGDLVTKLVGRHPHVFGTQDGEAQLVDPDSLDVTWDRIKAAEKGRTSVTEGVPLGQPSLSLAAKLQRRALRGGLPAELLAPGAAEPDAKSRIGDALFALVARAVNEDVEAEAALREAAKRFRARVLAAEQAMRDAGADATVGASWRAAWGD